MLLLLNGQQQQKLNNYGFEIDRSFDISILPDGKAGWRTIGFREGNGTTTEPQTYSYLDGNLSVGTYKYRLKQIDFDGSFEYSDIVEVEIAPSVFSLSQNYPNPFNPSTTISYQLPVNRYVTLKVYDILGNEVAALVNEQKTAGTYEIEFDATKLTSGVYFYSLQAGFFTETKKMILLK